MQCTAKKGKYSKTEKFLVSIRVSSTIFFEKDERMTCDLTSASTVFQSYRDDGRVIYVIKNCVQRGSGNRTRVASSAGQRFTYRAIYRGPYATRGAKDIQVRVLLPHNFFVYINTTGYLPHTFEIQNT